MGAYKKYCIVTANGTRHEVVERSLRTGLRKFDEKKHGAVIAAIEADCMPVPRADMPFLAVIMNSPNFRGGEGPG